MSTLKHCIVTILAVLLVAGSAFAQFGAPAKAVTAKAIVAPATVRPGGTFTLTMNVVVGKGYHIGANSKESLYPAKLTLSAPKGVKFAKPVYPPAKMKSFSFAPNKKLPVYEGKIAIRVKGSVASNIKPGKMIISATLDSQACSENSCYPPSKVTARTSVTVAQSVAAAGSPAAGTSSGGGLADRLGKTNLVVALLALYVAGLALAFTPCVYPMVPVTIGYFSNQCHANKQRVMLLAGVYVLGIALTYSTLGVIAAMTSKAFGTVMQAPSVVIGIAVILIALALSMFGLYELRVPSFVQSRASAKGGVLGALGMGLIFGIVAAPCVGPAVLGLMAYVAHSANPFLGFMMFFALALGIGTPLFFLATFSAKMPVPGMWMVTVKKLAGFLMLGAAAYFLAPITPHPFGKLLMPGVIIAAGIYLAWFEKTLHVNRIAYSMGKLGCVVAIATSVAILIPKATADSAKALSFEPYKPSIVATAAKSKQPVMIDFTAKWCMVCKELEEGAFKDKEVIASAANFKKLRVDGTVSTPEVQAAQKLYAVNGYPTLIFIDSSGKKTKIVGYAEAKDLARLMKTIK